MTEYELILQKLDDIQRQVNLLLDANNKQLPDNAEYEWADHWTAGTITGLSEAELKKRRVQLKDGTFNPDGVFRVVYNGASPKYYIPDLADFVDELLEAQNKKMNKPKRSRFEE